MKNAIDLALENQSAAPAPSVEGSAALKCHNEVAKAAIFPAIS